jgi:hypothetical protein
VTTFSVAIPMPRLLLPTLWENATCWSCIRSAKHGAQ